MSRNILCATDLTETSRPAFLESLRLAEAMGGFVTVLHVAAPAYPSRIHVSLQAAEALTFLQYARRGMETAQKTLDRWVEESGLGNVAVETKVLEGVPAEVILDTADALDADLIVVGTHGREGRPHWLLGSVSERVLRVARRPVLTVRQAPASMSGVPAFRANARGK